MSGRITSHQLSNGLYVSGRPEQVKERQPTIASRAIPYTGGDVKKSGELGKMFDIHVLDPTSNAPPPPPKISRLSSSSSQHNSGSVRSGSNSGTIPKKSSGPIPLQPTGLITSGPIGSGSLLGSSTGRGSSTHLESAGKAVYGPAVTSLSAEKLSGAGSIAVPKVAVWVVVAVVAMGLLVGGFLMASVKKAVVLVAVGGVVLPAVVVVVTWNLTWRERGLLGFVRRYPEAELRGAVHGQYVKVTGVVTCGSIPLESSYQRVSRCVYVSTELYEYKGWGGKSANPKHRCFSWGSRHTEKYVADFYISDFQSGLRALVKAGYGAKVAPFVKPATVVDVTKENRDKSPSFLQWLADRSLSTDDRIMRLKEGYIKEGSTVSVVGVVQRHENVLMIVPPTEPVSTGCQWIRCLLPTYVEGLILTCDDNQNADVVPV
ncbi:hypothetical protein I3760_10G075400 [Carya illinoinensis]|nr:hypothetical protein I3760_10G075400 [Carya illinoinensis]